MFILLFMLGAILGSFYTVIGIRLPLKQSIIFPHSHCMNCQRPLVWYELIPVISYLIQLGKCRSCQKSIGIIHSSIEFFTGVLFAFAYWKLAFSIEFLVALLFISLLTIITVSDIYYMVIQNRIILLFGVLLFGVSIYSQEITLNNSIAGAVFGFSLLALLSLLSKGGIGGGDIKLYLVIGFVLGLQNTFISLFLSSLFGLICAFILKSGFGKQMPFAPAIAAASIIAFFYGDSITQFYIGLLR